MSLYHTPLVEDEREPKRIEVKKMPLLPGKKNIGHNISEMESAGHPRAQAIAASLNKARESGAKIPKKNDGKHSYSRHKEHR